MDDLHFIIVLDKELRGRKHALRGHVYMELPGSHERIELPIRNLDISMGIDDVTIFKPEIVSSVEIKYE